jgi:thiol-disulfide isomerase/thioredoxin
MHGSSSVPSGTTTIVAHSALDPSAGISIREGVGIVGVSPSHSAGVHRKATIVEKFPAELACPASSACVVVVRKRVLAVVFAFDPVVEIDIDRPARGGFPFTLARYRDEHSTSAALGTLLRDAFALHNACKAGDTRRIAKLRRKLTARARRERRPVVRDATRLALVTEQCGTAPDLALARAVLEEIDPTSPALSLWTYGLVRARALLGRPATADAAIDEVIAKHPDVDVGAFLLERLAVDAGSRGDTDAEQRYDARLAAPRFARTVIADLRRFQVALRAPLRVHTGDAMPEVSFPALDGSSWLATADLRGAPQLVYFGASWCGGCIASLPKLHRFAAEHPEVRIVYVLWDSAEDAATFARERAPLPGTVVRADERSRGAIQAAFFELVALPSFVLADGEGRVVATSVDHELGELAGVLPADSP